MRRKAVTKMKLDCSLVTDSALTAAVVVALKRLAGATQFTLGRAVLLMATKSAAGKEWAPFLLKT